MTGGPQIAMLADGRRLHMHHGPIDLIIEAFGPTAEVVESYRQAARAFDGLLQRLVDELETLRTPIGDVPPFVAGPVARRMVRAVHRHRAAYVTPMAAVAGAVADEVLAAMIEGRVLDRAYVNDGGDIAIHLEPGHRFDVGLVSDIDAPALDGVAAIDSAMPVRGIATSGRGGRSLSLGIADSVTVLAADAAAADVAATLIANAVDVDSGAVTRVPASEVRDDTDLGELPVVVDVGMLTESEIDAALAAGRMEAERMRRAGLIEGAVMGVRGRFSAVGGPAVIERRRAG